MKRLLFEKQLIEFENLAKAEEFCTENDIDFEEIEEFDKVVEVEIIAPKTVKEKIDFGKLLIIEFLEDNNNMAQAFTPVISLQMLQTFSPIKQLCECGDLKNAKYLVQNTDVSPIFTQQRKDKYIAMIDAFLL
jgi:hypothetical protein